MLAYTFSTGHTVGMSETTTAVSGEKGVMEHLSTPWRWDYIRGQRKLAGCLFCLADAGDEAGIVARSEHVYVILNRYPYNNGHLMIAPYAHLASLENLTDSVQIDFMRTTKCALKCLREVYQPAGFNMGANIGAVAGAGVAAHFHWHIVPRWAGDSSFMTITAAARVLPETLPDTARKLREAWSQNSDAQVSPNG